jgi:hypothetical protein
MTEQSGRGRVRGVLPGPAAGAESRVDPESAVRNGRFWDVHIYHAASRGAQAVTVSELGLGIRIAV